LKCYRRYASTGDDMEMTVSVNDNINGTLILPIVEELNQYLKTVREGCHNL